MTFAIVPAAGKSIRMGRPKLSLPIGDRTVLEHVVAALRAADVERIIVVIGPHVPELSPIAVAAGADVVALPEPTSDMRSTVEHGLTWVERRFRPAVDEPWLLLPADHPTVDPELIRDVLATGTSDRPIVVPNHDGRRGHPTRFMWRHAGGIHSMPAGQGINTFVREHENEVRELVVSGDHIFADLDTPGDYTQLLANGFHHLLTNVSS
jgi:molybdenum cofactor cytidylyltransferase